jgi:hypothetical protein
MFGGRFSIQTPRINHGVFNELRSMHIHIQQHMRHSQLYCAVILKLSISLFCFTLCDCANFRAVMSEFLPALNSCWFEFIFTYCSHL